MDKVATVVLIAQEQQLDSIRQPVTTETRRTVYGTLKSVTRAEWAAAQQSSLSPSAVVKVFFADYCGEKLAELNGRRYQIYRVFGTGDYIELYLGEKVGELRE